jgi:Spy/CpxP family protein refolding chaperone
MIPKIHPAVLMWRQASEPARTAHAGCGSSAHHESWDWRCEGGGFGPGGGSFGVRRPLRFLAFKLHLDDSQVTALAQVLDELKTERAQAAVDDRRTLTAFADAISGESFDASKAEEGASLRGQSAERVNRTVVTALRRIHELLDAEQRSRLAFLIRTGAVLF